LCQSTCRNDLSGDVVNMEDEEIIAFVEGIEYHLKRIQEDLDRLKKELKKK